jgi:hypothetical protein
MFMGIPGPAAIYASIIPLLLLDTGAVCLRFYARRKRRQPHQTDDWLTVPALILIFGCASIIFYGVETKSLGYPAPVVPEPELAARSSVTASDWTIITARRVSIAEKVEAPLTSVARLRLPQHRRRRKRSGEAQRALLLPPHLCRRQELEKCS